MYQLPKTAFIDFLGVSLLSFFLAKKIDLVSTTTKEDFYKMIMDIYCFFLFIYLFSLFPFRRNDMSFKSTKK